MNWLVFALFALIIFTVYDLLSRHLSVKSKNPFAFQVVYDISAVILTPILLFIDPIPKIHVTLLTVAFTIFGVGAWTIFSRLEFLTHKNVEASVLTILERLSPILTFILSILFLRESLTLAKVAALVLTVIGSVLVIGGFNLRKIKKEKGILFGLSLAIVQGIALTFDKVLTPIYGVFVFSAITYFVPIVYNMFASKLSVKDLTYEVRLSSWKIVVLALCNVMAYGAMIKALTLADASKVIPIATATAPFVVIGGIVFLNERTNISKKIFAAVLIVIAIYLMR